MRLCLICGEREVYIYPKGKVSSYCKKCDNLRARKYYHENKLEISKKQKEYYNENKQNILERKKGYSKIYYNKNKQNILEKQREYSRIYYNKNRLQKIKKTIEYKKTHATEKQKRDDLIRAETRIIYPLEGQTCNFCDASAKEHHHYTNPIEFDKFLYVCKKHHKEEHYKMKKDPENYVKNIILKLPLFTLDAKQMGILEKKVETSYQQTPQATENKTQNYEQLSLF